MKWAALAGVANTMLAVIYATAGQEVFDLVDKHPGAFGSSVDMIQTLVPPLIGLIYLFVAIVIISGPFQYERARTQRRFRR
jgi:uncharacterized membrane protein